MHGEWAQSTPLHEYAILNPDFNAALEIMRMIQFPSAMNVETFADGHVDIAEVKIYPSSPFSGSSVGSISSKFKNRMIICAVARGQDVFIPNGDFVVDASDKIYITGHHKYLSSIVNKLNPSKKFDHIKNIMIVGGSRIAFYLAGMLEGQGKNVILVEKDSKQAEHLSDLLDKTTVICGDANDYDFMKEEGIENMDAVITLTDNDELNIMFTAFSESCNVPKNITKINNPKTKNIGKTLIDINFKNNVLIASIMRKGKIIFPKGDDTIEIGDRIIIVTKERKIEKINDIFD